METPAISRSGRVLKKSVKLLEMETDIISKISRNNVSKAPKNFSLDTSLISNNNNNNETISIKNTNNSIKMKLNLSGQQIQSEPKIHVTKSEPALVQESNPNNSEPELKTTTTNKTNLFPAKISTGISSLISKTKDDSKDMNISIKRENPEVLTENIKRVKLFEQDEVKKITTVQNNLQQSNQDPVVKIVQQPFKTNLSPILQIDKASKEKLQKSFASSTPKINTIITSKLILPRSIQEQRRINQANRAKLQQQQFQQQLQQKMQQSQNPIPQILHKQISSNSNLNYHHNQNTNADEENTKIKKPSISAYVLWCKENRSHIQSNYPELDFANLSKKMGSIWHTLPTNEKATWFRKAQIMAKQSSSGSNTGTSYCYDDKDLKPEIVLGSLTLPITKDLNTTFGENFINNETSSIEGETHQINTDLIDIQAYLSILGDSLMTISSYIQRGIKYNSEIKYSSMAAVSTLLDTALVSMGSMTSLTLSLPNVSVNKEKIKKTIENVTYFMPPSEF